MIPMFPSKLDRSPSFKRATCCPMCSAPLYKVTIWDRGGSVEDGWFFPNCWSLFLYLCHFMSDLRLDSSNSGWYVPCFVAVFGDLVKKHCSSGTESWAKKGHIFMESLTGKAWLTSLARFLIAKAGTDAQNVDEWKDKTASSMPISHEMFSVIFQPSRGRWLDTKFHHVS